MAAPITGMAAKSTSLRDVYTELLRQIAEPYEDGLLAELRLCRLLDHSLPGLTNEYHPKGLQCRESCELLLHRVCAGDGQDALNEVSVALVLALVAVARANLVDGPHR